jgi:hypothetical protein
MSEGTGNFRTTNRFKRKAKKDSGKILAWLIGGIIGLQVLTIILILLIL